MEEHETQKEFSSAASGDGCSEEAGNPRDEPEQRWQDQLRQWRDERIRVLMLAVSLLMLLVGFLLDLFAGTILPLFLVMVIAYLEYRGIDAWFNRHGPPGY